MVSGYRGYLKRTTLIFINNHIYIHACNTLLATGNDNDVYHDDNANEAKRGGDLNPL